MTKQQLAQPRYTHDCDRCRFLGAVDKYDLYLCPENPGRVTALARYGNTGPEYASRSFLEPIKADIHREISGLTDDMAWILAIFRGMPSLLLNAWIRPEE